MKIFFTVLSAFLLTISTEISSQSVSIESSGGGSITDFFSADGNTINIEDGSFGDVIKHIGRDVDGTLRPMRYVSYKYENGLVVTRQYDGTISIDYHGSVTINDDIDLSSLSDACFIINIHSGNIVVNADVITDTNHPGKGGSIVFNASKGTIINSQSINANNGSITLGAISLINQGSITTNNQPIFVEVDECGEEPIINDGNINAGTSVVVTPIALGNITGEIVANMGFNVLGITDENPLLDQTLHITNLSDSEFALDGGGNMSIPANGEVSTDGNSIFILTDKCVAIEVGSEITLTKNLIIVSPGSILTKDKISAVGKNISMYSGSIDIENLEVGLEGTVGLYAHTLIRTANIDATGDELHPVEARIVALSLGDIESLFNDANFSEKIEVHGLGSSISFVASKDLTSLPEDELDAIQSVSENTMISYIAFNDLSLINSQLRGNDDDSRRGSKILLMGRNKVEILDAEHDFNIIENGYLAILSSGDVILSMDEVKGSNGGGISAMTVLASGNYTSLFEDGFKFNGGDIFLNSGGSMNIHNRPTSIDIGNGILTAIAEDEVRIISDDLIDGNGGGSEGALLQFYSGGNIIITDFDIDGTPDGTIDFHPSLELLNLELPKEVPLPVKILSRELTNFSIISNPGGYTIEPNIGIITVPVTATANDILTVMYEDGNGFMYETDINIDVQNQGSQNFVSSELITLDYGNTITDIFSADGNTIMVQDGSYGEVCKHIGTDVDGITRPHRYVTYTYENGVTVSRQFDGSVLLDLKSGDLILDANMDLSSLADANITINLHDGNLIINGDLTTNTLVAQKGGNININVTKGSFTLNGNLNSNNGNIIIGASDITNNGSITNTNQNIFIHIDPASAGSFNNTGNVNAGTDGLILSSETDGTMVGNILSSDGAFSVNGITEQDIESGNVLTITALTNTQFEIDGGGLMAIPASGEVRTDGTTIFIHTGKAVIIDQGVDINITQDLEIVTPRFAKLNDKIDGTTNAINIYANLINVFEMDLDNGGGQIGLYASNSIEYGRLKIRGNTINQGKFLNLFALLNITSYNETFLVSGNIEVEGIAASANMVAGNNMSILPVDHFSKAIEVRGNDAQLSCIAYNNMILLDADIDSDKSADQRGIAMTILGRNLNQHLDLNTAMNIEHNGYVMYLTSSDINMGGYELNIEEKGAATFISPGNFSTDNDAEWDLTDGELFINTGGNIKIQVSDAVIKVEEGNFTAIAEGKVFIVADNDLDFQNGSEYGNVIIKSGHNILLSNYNGGDTGGQIDFRPTISTTCLPGAQKVPFPIEVNQREFFNFSLVSAPPGYSIDPVTGAFVIPADAGPTDEIIVSYEDDEGGNFTVVIAVNPMNSLLPIPTIGTWALMILTLIAFIFGVLRINTRYMRNIIHKSI